MGITARIIADSIQEDGGFRLTTFVLRYPRFIHSEFMTHRVFSRNAASSRAIPIKKMIQQVIDDPAVPVFWGKNRAGMQAAEELAGWRLWMAKNLWLLARWPAIFIVWMLMKLGLHKQIPNRILEPWMWIEVVATSSLFSNFYGLRHHPMAQPEFQQLASRMYEAHKVSNPKILKPGEWHLPFIKDDELAELQSKTLEYLDSHLPQKVSAARCARVSYLKHDGAKASLTEDLALYDRLMGGTPKHASPTEHQAKVPTIQDLCHFDTFKFSNLSGWMQFRKMIQGENITEYEEFKE